MQQLAPGRARQFAHRVTHGLELHPIKGGKIVLVLHEKIHIAFVHAIIDGRLDMKDVDVLIDNLPQANTLIGELRAGRIHVTVRIQYRLRFVMRPQAFVIAQSHGNRFVPAIHRHKIDISVNDQIAFRGSAISQHGFFYESPGQGRASK